MLPVKNRIKLSHLDKSPYHLNRQLDSNENVNNNAKDVQVKSEQIMNSMYEQKIAIEEIANTIAGISELSQKNTFRIEEMSNTSKSLALMVDGFNNEIENYKE